VGTPEDDDSDARIDREAILARRRRFAAAALTGLATSTLATACPCLKMAVPESAEPHGDGQPQDDGDPMEEASPEEAGAADGGEGEGEGEGDDAAEAAAAPEAEP
jgi:hypothetical protein